MDVVEAARALSAAVKMITFAKPIACVYNPLDYAWERHEEYLRRYAKPGVEAIFLGMNPGPFGMAQTGVPFGDVAMVRDWLGICGPVGKPECQHPKRPIAGFACARCEVSGQRVWGWARQRYGSPNHFFEKFFVANYCPLAFMEESGLNRTPDKLPRHERDALFEACDEHLRRVIQFLNPQWVIGVGDFAAKRAAQSVEGKQMAVSIGRILHPSPASPIANRGWAAKAEEQLLQLGIAL